MQELACIVEHEVPVKFAILNNWFLGMVRQWQEMFYDNRIFATREFGPDYVKLAEAFGVVGLRVTDKSRWRAQSSGRFSTRGPVLIDFQVEPDECVYPMVPPGASLSQTIDGRPSRRGSEKRRRR